MGKLKNAPSPLRNKIFLTVLAGMGCLFVGIVMCILAKDMTILFLSLAICAFSIFKAYTMYRVISKKDYEVVEGTCIGITPKLLGRFRKIKIADDEGNESTLLLSKQSKIKIGERYRFYFKNTTRVTLGNEYFDSALSSDCFLGYEAISK